MYKALISVIILSYNNIRYYKECLASVLEQEYENIEIIISDDASDQFNEIEIEQYILKNKRNNIKNIIINKNVKNMGIVKSYNKAIKMSKGEYIFYLSIDDVLYDKLVLTDVIRYFENNELLIATGYRDVCDESLKKYLKTLPRNTEVQFIKAYDTLLLFEKLCIGNFIGGCCTPFKRRLIEQYGYLDENFILLEDYPRYLSLLKQGCKIGFIDRKLIKYRSGGITTSGSISNILEQDLLKTRLNYTRDFFVRKYKDILKNLENKKIVVWGIGYNFDKAAARFPYEIKYFVDSSIKVQEITYCDKMVYHPDKLFTENRNDIYIFVFSYSNYFEIAEWLRDHSFIEEKDYYCCSAEILNFIY